LFTDNPEELPRLFAEETFAAARSAFLEHATDVEATAGLAALFGREVPLASRLGGYNVCRLRDGATLATITKDGVRAPAGAAWQAGAGRVVCFTGEADGEFAGELATWKGVGDYYCGLARWAAGASGPLPDGMMLTQEVRNGVNRVTLHLDPGRARLAFTGLP